MAIYKANKSPYREIGVIPTGFSKLDAILGVGGIPLRKITEVSGQFSVGKSTLGLQIVAQAQKMDMDCLWADNELSFGEDYATQLGVDVATLDLLQERLAEPMLDQMEEWIAEHKNALVVLDSVGNLLPRAEAEKGAGDKTIGGQAKLIATFCRKVQGLLAENNVALIVLNHQFTDLMSGKLMTSGGAKLAYSKSIWLMLRKANKRVMQGDKQVGDIIEAEVRKNKLAGTLKQTAELVLMYGMGFNKENDIMEDALKKGILEKKGNSFFFNGEKIAVGIGKLREALKDESLKSKIISCL